MKHLWKFLVVIFVIGALIAGGGLYYASTLLQPANPENKERKDFAIAKGLSVIAIGNRLHEQGFIKHPLAFRYTVWQEGLQSKIQAGSFSLSPSMTVSEIAQELTKGTNDQWVTVLEGWRVEEIAEMLAEQDLPEFDKDEFLKLAESQEGYMFPDTYLLPKTANAEFVFNLLRDTFEAKVEEDLEDEITKSGKELKDIVIMASIVEREARDFKQMQSVAGVLWNRVDIDMALNADATLQYIKGYDKTQGSWWIPPLAADKESTSPFNTYKYAGLPPRPIANPSLDAIKATLTPEKSENLYYIHDRKGNIHLAKDLDAHNRNVNTYLR